MHVGLTEEQQELAATVRSLLVRRADSAAVRSAATSEAGHDAALWQTLCEQIGAAALAIPEEHGGAGFTLFETGIVLTELGYSLAPSPLWASAIAGAAVLASADAAACRELLPRIAAGEVAALATGATGGPTGPNGTVEHVPFGDLATVLLASARTPDGPALFRVDPASVRREHTPAMDPTTRLARITFDRAACTVLDGGAAAAERAHLVRLVATACVQLGVAQRGLDMTVAYTKERVQFGRPIGSFQALKHRMADMLVRVEMSRSAAWAATYAVAHESPDSARLSAVAASYCTEALDHVAAETVQLHGGIAITWEHDAQLVLKRAHALRQGVGLPHLHRATLVD